MQFSRHQEMREPDKDQLLLIRQRIGTAFLWSGAMVAVLVFIDRSGMGVLAMPAFWYRSRSLHLAICVGFFVGGALLLRTSDDAHSSPNERWPTGRLSTHDAVGPVFDSVRLFTRVNCPLCDEAMDVLEEYGSLLPEIEFVDIDGEVELERLHGESIPVLEIDGRIRFRGRIHRWLLERHLAARLRQRERSATRGQA